MYRVVGCILIVAAGAGMGFSESFRFSERIRTLEMLLQLVICLRGEISCGNASLPDAFYGAAGRMNGKRRTPRKLRVFKGLEVVPAIGFEPMTLRV